MFSEKKQNKTKHALFPLVYIYSRFDFLSNNFSFFVCFLKFPQYIYNKLKPASKEIAMTS